MDAISVDVRRKDPTASADALEADLQTARFLANLLDAEFEVGGFRFGLDPILGVVPVIGDAIAVLIGSYLIHVARKHKLGKWLEARMAANLLLDWAVGSIPIAGDAFDVAFK